MGRVSVREFRVVDYLDTLGANVDEKQGIVVFVRQLGLKPEEVREITARDVPLFAIQDEVVTVLRRRRLEPGPDSVMA